MGAQCHGRKSSVPSWTFLETFRLWAWREAGDASWRKWNFNSPMTPLFWTKAFLLTLVKQLSHKDFTCSAETQEIWVPSLHGKDPLEEEMATHSRNLAWTISWMEEPGGLQPMGLQGVRHNRSAEHTPPPYQNANHRLERKTLLDHKNYGN